MLIALRRLLLASTGIAFAAGYAHGSAGHEAKASQSQAAQQRPQTAAESTATSATGAVAPDWFDDQQRQQLEQLRAGEERQQALIQQHRAQVEQQNMDQMEQRRAEIEKEAAQLQHERQVRTEAEESAREAERQSQLLQTELAAADQQFDRVQGMAGIIQVRPQTGVGGAGRAGSSGTGQHQR